jgi:hypothetical protein
MAHKINIMLILVLGVTSSLGKSLLNISEPIKTDRNMFESYAKLLHSIIQNLSSSARMVGSEGDSK